jgi:hypothetical protein
VIPAGQLWLFFLLVLGVAVFAGVEGWRRL